MRIYDLIMKKRNGHELADEELEFIVSEYTAGNIPDYQMSAFLMAVWFVGMNDRETVAFTMAMAKSGDMLDLSAINGTKIDKHSTGGVGDKTTLIVCPILASLGVKIAKMSGRGLGHTGGTIDKLESIPGFNTSISEETFTSNVNAINFALAGQTANLAPADKKIYALRDVTATVDNYSLIASSIMSKKLASGADAIVLDVKCGSGAFMKDIESAEKLATIMVSIGNMSGRRTVAVITDMNEPLGRMVGNSLEVKEAIEVLNGCGEERLTEVSKVLATEMLLLSDIAKEKGLTEESARELVENAISDGSALRKLAEFVAAQGGSAEHIMNSELFDKANYKIPVYPEKNGYLCACDTSEVGMSSLILGAGRSVKGEEINPRVGIEILKKLGDKVDTSEPFAYIYSDYDIDNAKCIDAVKRLKEAYQITERSVSKKEIVLKVIR